MVSHTINDDSQDSKELYVSSMHNMENNKTQYGCTDVFQFQNVSKY